MDYTGFTPAQKTRALYSHRIACEVARLVREHATLREVRVTDGQICGANKMQVKSLQDLLRKKFDNPDVTLCVRGLAMVPQVIGAAYASYPEFVTEQLNRFYNPPPEEDLDEPDPLTEYMQNHEMFGEPRAIK